MAVYEPAAAADLRIRLADTPVRVGDGEEALCAAAVIEGADCVVTGVSGSGGCSLSISKTAFGSCFGADGGGRLFPFLLVPDISKEDIRDFDVLIAFFFVDIISSPYFPVIYSYM